jgi:hypothetical protein
VSKISRNCQTSPRATVKDQPDLVSTISRNCVNDQVEPECPASPGARHRSTTALSGSPGNRTLNLRIKSSSLPVLTGSDPPSRAPFSTAFAGRRRIWLLACPAPSDPVLSITASIPRQLPWSESELAGRLRSREVEHPAEAGRHLCARDKGRCTAV